MLVAFVVAKRSLESAKKLVEQVKERSDGHIPLFTSDELPHYEDALKAVYGTIEVPPYCGKGRPPKRKILVPDPYLDYAQVVKTRGKGGLLKLASYHKLHGDTVELIHGCQPVSRTPDKKIGRAHV